MTRFHGKARSAIVVTLPVAVIAGGMFVGRLHSEEWFSRWPVGPVATPSSLVALEPVRVPPRTETVLAMIEGQRLLGAGRPYAAWETLIGHTDAIGPAGYGANLLAARAAMEWGGWDRVVSVLRDRPWLATVSRGDGLFYLARAEEELGNVEAAEPVYRAYLDLAETNHRGLALARLAGILSALGNATAAAERYDAAAAELPVIADWLGIRAREERASMGVTRVSASMAELRSGSRAVRARRALLDADGFMASGESGEAVALLDREATILAASRGSTEAAQLKLRQAEFYREVGAFSIERDLLRDVAKDAEVVPELRVDAAERLNVHNDARSAVDELARAAAFEVAGRPGRAAAALRDALELGEPETVEIRLRLARLLFEERDYGPARAAFQRVAELIPEGDAEARADAELHAARSLFRSGTAARTRNTALSELGVVADRFPGTAAAGTAHFLLGDEATTNAAGVIRYQRAAAVAHSPDAREALYRVGDRSIKLRRPADAVEAWEEYLRRYPTGAQTAQVAYELGRLHETAGRRERAGEAYVAAIAAEPTSYWAVRAGERAGIEALRAVKEAPRVWAGLASDPAEAATMLRRLDALEEAGLTEAWQVEYRGALRDFAKQPVAMLTLAEGLRDRGRVVEALQLGNRLLAERDGQWDDRLLRLVFPFPYRDLIVAEAERVGVDPMLYAGLVRQESTFRPRIRSRVGATGLGQIMPATGRALAPAVGIREFDASLLEVPEVNLRMGTKYFGDLVRRYGGATDLALAGYNAGPSRADRWRRQYSYGRDTDAFRAAIPFSETRNYVMVVLRNAAIYRSLYGTVGAPESGAPVNAAE